MATQAKVRLRWSSGALSLALHAIVIVCALLFGMVSVEKGRRAPPLEATLLPLPEPLDLQDYRESDAPRAREDAAGSVRSPIEAPGRTVSDAVETPSFSLSPVIRDTGAAGGEGAGPGDPGLGRGGGQGTIGASPGAASGASPAFARPEWIERLSAAQMLPYFPRSAIQLHMNGTAWLACQVDAQGRARRCRILREAPQDYGFGPAALRMSRLFRIRPPQRDGLPQYDSWVRIQIDFEVP
jgi:TonB family protein